MLWHSSLIYSRLGYQLKSKNKKKAYFTKAKRRAMRALKLEQKNSMANYAMAIALGRITQITSNLQEKISASRRIRRYAVRALKIDSDNAGAWDILSQWDYGIANLKPFKRSVAESILGDMAKQASFKRAIKYAKKAVRFNPKMLNYYWDLARTYKALGKNKKAVKTCRKAIGKTPVWQTGYSDIKKCRDMIDSLAVK